MAPARVVMWGLLGNTSLSFMLTRLSLPQVCGFCYTQRTLSSALNISLHNNMHVGVSCTRTGDGVD